MLIRTSAPIPSSEITDEGEYLGRRQFIARAGLLAAAGAGLLPAAAGASAGAEPADTPTPFDDVTTYNNFYEFGTDKADPSDPDLNGNFRATPWSVRVDGLVQKPAAYALEDFLTPNTLEDRTYRLRCVEGWSMVIPWRGFPLASVLARAQPLPRARFVEFTTLHDPRQFPGQRRSVLEWPYVEGLRLDEAMHPLTILATGLYGKTLLPQNGAPLRLVVPWKYGFKSIKSIVRIRLTDSMPKTAWNVAAPDEYGFFANVNPTVDHPRWSQAKERRIGEFRRRKTLMFNGYGREVARLYSGLDLRRWF